MGFAVSHYCPNQPGTGHLGQAKSLIRLDGPSPAEIRLPLRVQMLSKLLDKSPQACLAPKSRERRDLAVFSGGPGGTRVWKTLNAVQIGEPEKANLDKSGSFHLKRQRPRSFLNVAFINSGDDLLSHTLSRAVQSARRGLTSVFGMGTGGTPAVRSPEICSRILSAKMSKSCRI